jgi:hypothetical protein
MYGSLFSTGNRRDIALAFLFRRRPDRGLTRLLYSPEWLQAQQAFKQR